MVQGPRPEAPRNRAGKSQKQVGEGIGAGVAECRYVTLRGAVPDLQGWRRPNGTPELCYTSSLLSAIRDFEGSGFNGNGDFALDAVIRRWDIVAALILLDRNLIADARTNSGTPVKPRPVLPSGALQSVTST